MRAIAILLFLTLVASNAWTQNGKREWGYEYDSGSATRRDEAIRIFNNASPVALTPEGSTDKVLQSFTMSNVEGHRVIHVGDQFRSTDKDFFWFVDTRTNTYGTINISWDVNADAERIQNALRAKLPQQTFSLDRFKQKVAEIHTLKLGIVADNQERSAGLNSSSSSVRPSDAGHDDDENYPNCWGNASATIVTYDPLVIMLTYTTSYAHWYYPGNGSYITTGGGECWANPDSDAGTSWFVDSCTGTDASDSFHSRYTTVNDSYNYDFGFDNVATWVSQKSEVRHDHGWARYVTSHKDWGEGHELIYGYVLIAYASCG